VSAAGPKLLGMTSQIHAQLAAMIAADRRRRIASKSTH
jgi:hypothetical protein